MIRKIMLYLLAFAQSVVFITGLASCGLGEKIYTEPKEDPNIIKIGVIEPFDGIYSPYVSDEYQGFVMAHELRKEALGKPVRLVMGNSESNIRIAGMVAEDLINNKGVNAIVGGYNSSLSQSVANVAKKFKIPFVTPSATAPKITRNNPYTFRCCYTDDYQGEQLAYYLAELGVERVAIAFDEDDNYSIGNAAYFRQAFKKIHGKKSIVYFNPFKNPPPVDPSKDRFFIDDCQQIKVLAPEAVFLPSQPIFAANFIEQAKSEYISMHDTYFVCTDSCYQQEFIKYGGDHIEGVLLATPFFSGSITGEAGISFVEAYRKRYGQEPNAGAALAFDAYNLIIDAIERAKSSEPEKIRDALERTREYEGTTGDITMNKYGDPLKPIFIISVQGGVFTAVNVIEPDMSEEE